MTREEIENCIVNTLFECTHSGKDDTISDKEFAEVLADKFINHEQDLLKEFVEWYKAHLNYLIKHEKDLYADIKDNKHEGDATFFAGEINKLEQLVFWIDIKLEQFLDEKL